MVKTKYKLLVAVFTVLPVYSYKVLDIRRYSYVHTSMHGYWHLVKSGANAAVYVLWCSFTVDGMK